jgi:hypothetical protein
LLRFFKTNAPFQIISLFVLFAILRIPQILYGTPLVTPEFKWLLIGERLASGNVLYAHLHDDLGPLSGFVYMIVHFIAGRSATAQQILAAVIILIQLYYVTLLAHGRQFFQERNYVPGLVLLVLYNLSFDFYLLSPALMGGTFLLFAFGRLVRQLDSLTDKVFQAGCLIGVAFLFFPPYLIFIVWALFVISMFTGARLRQQLLLMLGFVLPLGVVVFWYAFNGHLAEFLQYFLVSIVKQRQFVFNEFSAILAIYLLPLILSVFGFFVAIAASRYNNFQTRIQQFMLIWLATSVFAAIFMNYFAPHQFIFMLYPLAHFIVVYFASFRSKWLAELFFMALFGLALYVNYQSFVPALANSTFVKMDNLILKKPDASFTIKNKKVLVLGYDLSPYLYNQTTTPYINWSMAKNEVGNLNQYESVIKIMENFETDKPQIIVDQENFMPKIGERLPKLMEQYKPLAGNIYQLK